MFDLFAGCGGYWTVDDGRCSAIEREDDVRGGGGGGGPTEASENAGAGPSEPCTPEAMCVQLGTAACLVQAAAAEHPHTSLSNVWAAEKLSSFHRVLQHVLVHVLQNVPSISDSAAEFSPEGWATTNARCGPWGRELMGPLRRAAAGA